jgi:antitoxin MazE
MLTMKAQIKKWGNSFALRIPKSLASEMNLEIDTPVEISADKQKKIIIIKQINKKKYSLENLLTGVTDKNIHKEFETGKPVGKEIW